MTTHELANQLLAKTAVEVSDTLVKRVLEKPNGTGSTGVCWCGCGGSTKGRFVPGHDAKYHALAKKVAAGTAAMPDSFVHDDAKTDFLKVLQAQEQKIAAKETALALAAAAKKEEGEKEEGDSEEGEEETVETEAPENEEGSRPEGGVRLSLT